MSRQGMPAIPKDLGRDMMILVEYFARSITELQKESTDNKKRLASEDQTKRLDRKNKASTVKEVNQNLDELDSKTKWAIIGEIESLEARVEDYIEIVRLEILASITDAVAINNEQLLIDAGLLMDEKIQASNDQLLIDIEQLIDQKIAEQHTPPAE